MNHPRVVSLLLLLSSQFLICLSIYLLGTTIWMS